jgi:hypothetical protein
VALGGSTHSREDDGQGASRQITKTKPLERISSSGGTP